MTNFDNMERRQEYLEAQEKKGEEQRIAASEKDGLEAQRRRLLSIGHCPWDTKEDEEAELTEPYCHANRDGDCKWVYCPQPLIRALELAMRQELEGLAATCRRVVDSVGPNPSTVSDLLLGRVQAYASIGEKVGELLGKHFGAARPGEEQR